MQAPALAAELPPLHWELPFEWGHEIDAAQLGVREIVSGVITEGGMSMVYGDSNSGKTYMVLHMCFCIAQGVPWLGCEVERGLVIYVACESAMSIRRRYVAHCKHFGLERVSGFGIVPSTISLMDPSADVDGIISLVKEKTFEMGEPVQLIVIDTVARAMAGGNENAGEDISRLVGGSDRIRQETGAHVLLIHHSGKDAAKGARGHSSLRAALDTELEVTGDERSNVHVARVTKQRDLAGKGTRYAARFVSVDLGTDQWGKPVTACALERADAADAPASEKKDSAGSAASASRQAVAAFLAGQKVALKTSAIVDALTGVVSRAAVYRAVKELIDQELVSNTNGLIYAYKRVPPP